MSKTNELLTTFVDKERRYFNDLASRLRKFDQLQRANDVAAHIYRQWYDCYKQGVKKYQTFDAAAQSIKSGDVMKAREYMGIHPNAPMTGNVEGDRRILALMLINDYLGSTMLARICQERNQALVNTLINLSINQPDAADDLEDIVCWLCTFPHLQDQQEDPQKPEFFYSIWETGLKVAAGFALGWYWRAKDGSPQIEPEEIEEGTGYQIFEGPPPQPE
jgi:hypothetical protein